MNNYEELAKLAEAATPGPWWDKKNLDWVYPQTEVQSDFGQVARFVRNEVQYCCTIGKAEREWANAAFIAAANPAAILALLSERTQLAERVASLEAARVAYANEFPLNADGEPDVGNIHANIRALKKSTPPQPVEAAKGGEPVALPFAILADEMKALRRFDECVRDGQGYDVAKDMMKRLAEIGLVRRVTAAIYEHTNFGLSVLNGDFANPPAPTVAPSEVETKIRAMRCKNPYSEDNCNLYGEGYAVARQEAAILAAQAAAAPVMAVPEGWKLVPIEPTEDMITYGFKSAPAYGFCPSEEWEKYDALTGCQQAAYRAKACYAAMIAAAPTTEGGEHE